MSDYTPPAGGTGGSSGAFNPTVGMVPYLAAANTFADSPMIREDPNTISLRTGSPTALRLYKAGLNDPGKYFLVDNRNDAGGTPRWIIQGTANQFNPTDLVGIGNGGNTMVFGDATMFPVANGGVFSSVGTANNRVNTFYAWNWLDIRPGSSFDWTGVRWTNSTRLISYGDGRLSIDGNADNTAGSRLIFGVDGAVGAPMFKRNGAGIDLRLADDSAYANLGARISDEVFNPEDDGFDSATLNPKWNQGTGGTAPTISVNPKEARSHLVAKFLGAAVGTANWSQTFNPVGDCSITAKYKVNFSGAQYTGYIGISLYNTAFTDGMKVRVMAHTPNSTLDVDLIRLDGGAIVGTATPAYSPEQTIYVHLQRVGTLWSGFYSFNGVTWLPLSANFTKVVTINVILLDIGQQTTPNKEAYAIEWVRTNWLFW